jgi:hypothetical protein
MQCCETCWNAVLERGTEEIAAEEHGGIYVFPGNLLRPLFGGVRVSLVL